MSDTMESQLTTADLARVASGGDWPEHTAGEQYNGPLLTREFSNQMRTRWETIQMEFVDDPDNSVQEADELVATAIKKLAESFAEERCRLEHEWFQGKDVSTEDLRQALRRYRAFFDRLLAV